MGHRSDSIAVSCDMGPLSLGHEVNFCKKAILVATTGSTDEVHISTCQLNVAPSFASCFPPWRAREASGVEIPQKMGKNYKICFPGLAPKNGEKWPKKEEKLL